jgi:hypothetical protein
MVATIPQYSAPAIYRAIESAMFILCPGLWLQVFTIGIGSWFAWMLWAMAALMNGPIYYFIGLIPDALIKRARRSRAAFHKTS